jgi:IclR family transcriptional regulator, pca regulon regulatory protein
MARSRPTSSPAGAARRAAAGTGRRVVAAPAATDDVAEPSDETATPLPGRAERGDRPEYRVEALAKGLRILSLFDEQRPTWRVTDLAAAAGLPMPTVYRVVMTLTAEGYLDHLPTGEYRPGVRTLTLGTAALRSFDLVGLATPKLQRLAESTGETVNLAVLTGDRVLYLVRLRNSDLVTANIQVGSTLPAVHTSIGKLLLAYLDDDDLRTRITAESFAAQHGPNAKVSLAELRAELAQIREQGWSMQDEELAYGLRSVAGPIQGPGGAVLAGVNLAVQARDWSTQRIVRELKPVVLAACAEISQLASAGSAR